MNELKVDLKTAIAALKKSNWSQRAIARELGIDRGTVRKYFQVEAKPATEATAGSELSKPAISTPGSSPEGKPKPVIPTAGSGPMFTLPGRPSFCERWSTEIEAAVNAGLSAQRIYQDLVTEHQFAGSYQSVKRFVRKLAAAMPLPFRRMECAAGQEVQVDFGQGAWVMAEGKRKRPHLFRMVLSHSRKGYSEVVWQQTTENFVRCLENAFRHFGGVTHTTVIDNLRAAVTKADWFDPQLNPKITLFAEHYGTVILPTKPYTPRHKGKIEAGIKYTQNNALKGRTFQSLGEQNQFLLEWEKNTADTRIHGTTRQQVGHVFTTAEKPKLLPLPSMVFPAFSEAPRMVHLDGHVEVAKTYYSVPPEYVGRKVWARWETRLVRIFNQRMEQIAVHARQQPGNFSTDPVHIHSRKRAAIENGSDWLLDRARLIGKHSGTWAEVMMKNRGPQGIRVLQGFLQLAAKHAPINVEAATQLALTHGGWHLHDIKSLLQRPCAQDQFEFVQEHPLIRDLSHYQALMPDCFASVTETIN
ncbi:MAG: IS21 family transposase [Verrucomicrobia bacterium]|nr:IS21 family transposase [Verrucomicrobiota bacterium]